ncbi:MAG: tyrosine-type recombinase/integrase [Actinomycetota bacterium]|nr:tyrosine-type recombinase/integrase [Actinomycetota bacterium]
MAAKGAEDASSIRSITISAVTAELLAGHLEAFANPGVDGLVFPNNAGHPLISSSWWNNNFAPARHETGLSCRFHDLRHTSVALAIAEGAHPKAIQTRMGHSSIRVTLDRYGHLFPELDEGLAASFGARLVEAREKRSQSTVVHAAFGHGSTG